MDFTATYNDGNATVLLIIQDTHYQTLLITEGHTKDELYPRKQDAILAFSRLIGGELASLDPKLEPLLTR